MFTETSARPISLDYLPPNPDEIKINNMIRWLVSFCAAGMGRRESHVLIGDQSFFTVRNSPEEPAAKYSGT